jgi:hypothetical protein
MAARKSSRRKGGAKSAARKGGAKKASRGAKKSSARKKPAKRGGAKKSAPRRPAKSATGRKPAKRSSAPKRKSPMQRVRSVAKQVAQQAQAAVVGGVEALREMGGNVADRVSERVGGPEQA